MIIILQFIAINFLRQFFNTKPSFTKPIANMVPNPNFILDQILAWFEDSHMTAPNEVDAQHPGALNRFGCIVGIKNQGKTLIIVTKQLNPNGECVGLSTSTKPLPDDFEAIWCRILFKDQRPMVLVMASNRQDFIIYDMETGHDEGHWTLFDAFPEGSFLMSAQEIDESFFSLTYIFDDNEISVECRFHADEEQAVA